MPADVTRPVEVEQLVKDVLRRLGRVDVLVNNAGAGVARPFADVDDAAWRSSVELNLLAAVRLIRALVPAMRGQGGGAIVNVATLSGKRPRLGQIASNVTKEVAPVVVFLASPVAAAYITGVSVEVDGGLGRGVEVRGVK